MAARALVVGVPSTIAVSGLPDLAGAPGDAAAVAAMLRAHGFVVETSSDSTHSQLVNASELQASLFELAAQTRSGDVGVLYFSGHGYRVPDSDDDEPGANDRWDECLVCSDELLVDDWFRNRFWPATQPGSRWVTCVDACYSATAAFEVNRERDDGDERPLFGLVAIETAPIPIVTDVGGSRWRLTLSACGDGEEALELPDSAVYGLARSAATSAMLATLDVSPQISYVGLWERVQQRVTALVSRHALIGTPTVSSSGPDDTLLHDTAFLAR